MKKSIPFFILLFLLLLVACTGFAFTPESAATQELIEYNAAIADSIRVHQTQPWEGKMVVLASYLSNERDEAMSCEAVLVMTHEKIGWRMAGSGIGCTNPPSTEAVTYGSGSQGMPPDAFSYAHGLVELNAAEWVEITWGDSIPQRVSVVNGSYLALRDGSVQMIARVEVLDAAEEVIHEIVIMSDVQKIP